MIQGIFIAIIPQLIGIQARFHLLGASMGEYVIQTGLDFEMGFCGMFDEPVILAPNLKLFGFVATDCPPSP
ncbi:hypothetical protein KQX54_000084, partial [Cotesia glomerata]